MGKVFDITPRLSNGNSLGKDKASESAEIHVITDARREMIRRDQRVVKRTILTEFVGAFVILPEKGLLKAALYDISDNGLSFDLDFLAGSFSEGDEVAMRVYLNHTTYFPFTVQVTWRGAVEDEGVVRHGATFVKGTVNDVALHHFVKFIENVSASLKTDTGDVLVSNIS